MSLFLVQKWRSGSDAHGDDFDWQYQDIIIEAQSEEVLLKVLAIIGRSEIYAREYLNLRLVSEYTGDREGVTLQDFLGGYPDALARFVESILQ